MPYNPSIPQPTDNLSDSQNDILNNFSSANTSFGINHFAFDNATANNGKHNFVEMPVRGAIPAPLSASEATVYTKTATSESASTESNLYFTPDNSGNEYQLTRPITGKFASFGTSAGWTFLPGGLIMQWGTVIQTSSGNGTVNLPIDYSSGLYSVTTQPIYTVNTPTRGYDVAIKLSALNSFDYITFTDSSSYRGFTWIAIGK